MNFFTQWFFFERGHKYLFWTNKFFWKNKILEKSYIFFKHSWPVQMIFSVISSFYYTVSLFTFFGNSRREFNYILQNNNEQEPTLTGTVSLPQSMPTTAHCPTTRKWTPEASLHKKSQDCLVIYYPIKITLPGVFETAGFPA